MGVKKRRIIMLDLENMVELVQFV